MGIVIVRLELPFEIIQNNAPFTSIDIHEPIDLKMANFAMKIWKRNLYK